MSQSLILDESSNVFVIINSKIGLLRDGADSEINKIESWTNDILNQTKNESLIRKERCEICHSKEDCFEGHHIAGRKHDWRQITSCKPCHDELSLMQKTRDVRWLKSNQSDNLRVAFFLQGLQDILILKFKKTGELRYWNLGYSYVDVISELLKGENHE